MTIQNDPLGDARDFVEHAWGRLKEACAVLTAIEEGELLSACPEAPDARRRHFTAVCLLTIMQRDLMSLALEFEEIDHRADFELQPA